MYNSAPVLENDSHKLLWNFNIQTDQLIPARRADLIIIKKKKKRIFFAVPADHRINLKESEKKDKYLARELKKLWNMKVTIVPIVIGAFDTVTKGLLKGLDDLEVGGRVETIQTTALLRTARILRRVLATWGDLLSLKLQWKTITDVKNSKGVKMIKINGKFSYAVDYDMVPQGWIKDFLKMYKISYEVIIFIEKTMENWRVEELAGGKTLAEVKIQKVIF